MKPKLSAERIRSIMPVWLCTISARKAVRDLTDFRECVPDSDVCSQTPEGFVTVSEKEKATWEAWNDYMAWRLRLRHVIGLDDIEFHFGRPRAPYFDVPMIGWSNMKLVNKCCTDHGFGSRCIIRMFEPNNELGDTYQLKVISTPNDLTIIGWAINVN